MPHIIRAHAGAGTKPRRGDGPGVTRANQGAANVARWLSGDTGIRSDVQPVGHLPGLRVMELHFAAQIR